MLLRGGGGGGGVCRCLGDLGVQAYIVQERDGVRFMKNKKPSGWLYWLSYRESCSPSNKWPSCRIQSDSGAMTVSVRWRLIQRCWSTMPANADLLHALSRQSPGLLRPPTWSHLSSISKSRHQVAPRIHQGIFFPQ